MNAPPGFQVKLMNFLLILLLSIIIPLVISMITMLIIVSRKDLSLGILFFCIAVITTFVCGVFPLSPPESVSYIIGLFCSMFVGSLFNSLHTLYKFKNETKDGK